MHKSLYEWKGEVGEFYSYVLIPHFSSAVHYHLIMILINFVYCKVPYFPNS
jgi:hypothetical protein